MTQKYGQSPLWAYNSQTRVTETAIADLTGFKSGAVNFKIALFDPQVNGMRYLKTLIYNLGAQLSTENWTRLRNIRNRDVGDPITVRYAGERICLDYLQAVYELEFIAGHLDLTGRRVLEIGAGYGRTCHALLSNVDVEGYCIIDLRNTLALARTYLAAVLDEAAFAKITFVPVDEIDRLPDAARFDLCVNIDSFAEMDSDTVLDYLALIARRCVHFYVNNPVGKYLDKSLDQHSQGADVVELALRTGLLRDIIDIHDSEQVHAHAGKFIEAYRPAEDWVPLADARTIPWTYYWQALYRRRAAPADR